MCIFPWTHPVASISEELFYEQSEEGEVGRVESDHLQRVDYLKVLVEHGELPKTVLVN